MDYQPKDPGVQQSINHFDLSIREEFRSPPSLEQFCVKQSYKFSNGQARVAVALNRISDRYLTDKDIDAHYGFRLLEALRKESPENVTWRDAGDLGEETWLQIQATLQEEKLPVVVAYARKDEPSGYIITLLKVEEEIVTTGVSLL